MQSVSLFLLGGLHTRRGLPKGGIEDEQVDHGDEDRDEENGHADLEKVDK